jgi:signal transduction histidine kinase
MFVVEDGHDSVLDEQLARLDAIERRQEMLYAACETELTGSAHGDVAEPPIPEEAWPEAIPAPPAAEDDLAAHLAWMDMARAVLSARAARNRDELQRISSQWLVAQRHLDRVRPEEVAALVETQARVRERIAADETVSHLLRTLGTQLAAWESAHPAQETPLPQADLTLVRRLLDESAEQRARAARELTGTVMEVLCGVALDLEVVQRQVESDPGSTAGAFAGLGSRIAGAVDDLRSLPHTELVMPAEGEPLHAALRRCVDRHQSRLTADLAWSGAEPAAAEVRAALVWVAQEFLLAAADGGARACGLALRGGADGTLLALTADTTLTGGDQEDGGVEPGWLLRCRARAAVAGGVLSVDPTEVPRRCAVEVRFPAAL